MKQEIILNCVPPFSVDSPSPALSVLHAYLQNNGYNVRVIYWNILLYDLENAFLWDKQKTKEGDYDSTLLYAAYLAVKQGDDDLYKEVKAILQTLAPIMLNDPGFYDEHIAEFVEKLETTIESILDSIDFSATLYFGFSLKFNQWVLSSILAEKIKQRDSSKRIVIGGINTPEVARCYLEKFNCFDIATYGEGEIPLKLISDAILNDVQLSDTDIPRTYFRKADEISKCSDNLKNTYSDLSDKRLSPIYNDYFTTLKQANLERSSIIIVEGSRGCHWNRCHFCYLNKGYVFRRKDVDTVIYEIRKAISEFGILRIEFADNDAIGNDMQNFNHLLDELIAIKQEYPDFTILAFEIITQNVNMELVEKMKAAGVSFIQIGYESSSDSLLKKIEKKNSFASNLNVIKHCVSNQISVTGINVIRNLLEETTDDIYQSIENLRFYRFFINKSKGFIHIPIQLGINSSSKYYHKIESSKNEYFPEVHPFQRVFEKSLDDTAKWHLFEYSKPDFAPQWEHFNVVQYHYLNNEYQYEITNSDNSVTYTESYNGNELEVFELNEKQQNIIKLSYNLPISIHQLFPMLKERNSNITETEIRNDLDFLFNKGIVYHSDNYEEITSIVSINKKK